MFSALISERNKFKFRKSHPYRTKEFYLDDFFFLAQYNRIGGRTGEISQQHKERVPKQRRRRFWEAQPERYFHSYNAA